MKDFQNLACSEDNALMHLLPPDVKQQLNTACGLIRNTTDPFLIFETICFNQSAFNNTLTVEQQQIFNMMCHLTQVYNKIPQFKTKNPTEFLATMAKLVTALNQA